MYVFQIKNIINMIYLQYVKIKNNLIIIILINVKIFIICIFIMIQMLNKCKKCFLFLTFSKLIFYSIMIKYQKLNF